MLCKWSTRNNKIPQATELKRRAAQITYYMTQIKVGQEIKGVWHASCDFIAVMYGSVLQSIAYMDAHFFLKNAILEGAELLWFGMKAWKFGIKKFMNVQ